MDLTDTMNAGSNTAGETYRWQCKTQLNGH